MIYYSFILGANPVLAMVEIEKVLESANISYEAKFRSKEAMILSFESVINEKELISKLGGTIKIGRVFQEIPDWENFGDKIEEVISLLRAEGELKEKKQKKIKFGFSLYLGGGTNGQSAPWSKKFDHWGIVLKKSLKNGGYNARYLVSRERFLSAVILEKEKILEQGFDLQIIFGENINYLAKTAAYQDFSGFANRDLGRPRRDERSGMLPVKLAKMMVNLSQTGTGEIILDPFCGSGTILQEALVLGYHNLLGADESQAAITNTRHNLDWLAKKNNISNLNLKLFFKPVQTLAEDLPGVKVGAIISEPYLGSPHKSQAKAELRRQEAKIIADLYLKAFQTFTRLIKPGGRIIIIWPVYHTDGSHDNVFLADDLLAKIIALGFIHEPLGSEFYQDKNFRQFVTKRGTILYSRVDQLVQREILSFKFKG